MVIVVCFLKAQFSVFDPHDFLKWFQKACIKKNVYDTSIVSLKEFDEYFLKSKEIIYIFNSKIKNTTFNNIDNFESELNKLLDISELNHNCENIVKYIVEVSMIFNLKHKFLISERDLSKIDKKFQNLSIMDFDSEKCLENLSFFEANMLNVDLNETDVCIWDKYLTSKFNTHYLLFRKINDLNKIWIKYFVTNLKLRH